MAPTDVKSGKRNTPRCQFSGRKKDSMAKEKTPRCQGKKRREILRERKREALGRKVSKVKKKYAIASHVR